MSPKQHKASVYSISKQMMSFPAEIYKARAVKKKKNNKKTAGGKMEGFQCVSACTQTAIAQKPVNLIQNQETVTQKATLHLTAAT